MTKFYQKDNLESESADPSIVFNPSGLNKNEVKISKVVEADIINKIKDEHL